MFIDASDLCLVLSGGKKLNSLHIHEWTLLHRHTVGCWKCFPLIIFNICMCICQIFGKGGSSLSRCDLRDSLIQFGCGVKFIEFPVSSMRILENVPLSDKAGGSDDITQIQPQKIHLTLRPGMLLLQNIICVHNRYIYPWTHISQCNSMTCFSLQLF